MCEKETKRQRIHDLLKAKPKPIFFVYRIKAKKKILQKKSFLRKRREIEQKRLFNHTRYGD